MKPLDAKFEVNLNVLTLGLGRLQDSAFFLEMRFVSSKIRTGKREHYHAPSAKMKKRVLPDWFLVLLPNQDRPAVLI